MILRSRAFVAFWLVLWAGSVGSSACGIVERARAAGDLLGVTSGQRGSEQAFIGVASSTRAECAIASSKPLPRAGNALEQKVARADCLGLAAATTPLVVALRAFALSRIERSAAPLRVPFSTAPARAPPSRA